MKKRMIRFLSMLVVFAMMLQPIAGMVNAEETGIQTIEPITMIQINPLYEGIITEDMLDKTSDYADMINEEIVYHTSKPAATQELRDEMIDRQTTVLFGFQTDAYSEEIGKKLIDEFFTAAMVHTGVPKEGDSIKWQWGGFKGTISGYSQNGIYYLTLTYAITY